MRPQFVEARLLVAEAGKVINSLQSLERQSGEATMTEAERNEERPVALEQFLFQDMLNFGERAEEFPQRFSRNVSST